MDSFSCPPPFSSHCVVLADVRDESTAFKLVENEGDDGEALAIEPPDELNGALRVKAVVAAAAIAVDQIVLRFICLQIVTVLGIILAFNRCFGS